MELTIESAFSPGGLLGNASYILLIVSMAMRNILMLRIFAVLSGITGVIYDAFWLHDPVGTFWESCFTLVNTIQWIWLVIEKRRLKLTETEQSLKARFFPNISDSELKQLFNCSTMKRIKAGHVLTRQDKAVEVLYMLTEGEIEISHSGSVISKCEPGDLIGELGFLTKTPASATAIATTECTVIEFSHQQISTLIKNSADLANIVNRLISENLKNKLLKWTPDTGLDAS